jgi:hypothetical protein
MKKVLLVVGFVAIVSCSVWAYQAWSSFQANARTHQFNEDVEDLFTALQMYKERMGAYPVGNNAEVVKSLMGNNSKNLIILVGRKKDINSKGEFIDPWGTPLRFYFAGEGILIRSAGPNKRFDDSTVLNPDDYYRSN